MQTRPWCEVLTWFGWRLVDLSNSILLLLARSYKNERNIYSATFDSWIRTTSVNIAASSTDQTPMSGKEQPMVGINGVSLSVDQNKYMMIMSLSVIADNILRVQRVPMPQLDSYHLFYHI